MKSKLKGYCLSRGLKHCGFHICVLGTIGAGKTTLCTELKSVIEKAEGRCEGLFEPVAGNPLLPLFYKDKKRYALAMQVYMLNKRLEQQRTAQDLALSGISCVQDSSIYGDTCFVDMLTKDGIIEPEEVDVYSELFVNMSRDIMYPTLVVYLNCSPEVALYRIAKRGREYEKGIQREYVNNLNSELKELCDEFSNYTFVKEINADKDLSLEEIHQLAESIYEEVKELRKNPIVTRIGV